ncbi:hypothetical protein KKA08_07305, partial [bacterium]|nr:hypothetical protein [bacterium]
MRIAFYTSAHGYGHASRSFEIARALVAKDPEMEIFFMSSVPDSFFAADEHKRIQRRNCRLDVGIRQIDSLRMDLPGTLADLELLEKQSAQLVVEEADFLNNHEIKLALVDLPFLAFEAAHQAKIPAWGISNFTWDWIYEDYLDDYPKFQAHIERIRSAYCLAEGIFRLPFHHDMPEFRQIDDTPLVARKSILGCHEARKRLQIDPEEK